MSIPARAVVRSSTPKVSSRVPRPPTPGSNFSRWTTNITISTMTMASTHVASAPSQGRRQMFWQIPTYLIGHYRTTHLDLITRVIIPLEVHHRRPPARSPTFAIRSCVRYAAVRSPHLIRKVVCAATSRPCRFHLRAPGTVPCNHGVTPLQTLLSSDDGAFQHIICYNINVKG